MVVGLVEKGALDDGLTVLPIPLRQELHGLRHTLRGLEKSLALNIFAQEAENLPNVPLEGFGGRFVVLFYLMVSHIFLPFV